VGTRDSGLITRLPSSETETAGTVQGITDLWVGGKKPGLRTRIQKWPARGLPTRQAF